MAVTAVGPLAGLLAEAGVPDEATAERSASEPLSSSSGTCASCKTSSCRPAPSWSQQLVTTHRWRNAKHACYRVRIGLPVDADELCRLVNVLSRK
jgi:hypothetical protein